ncbi:MAG: hypothetical protein H8E85_03705 [Candidatus Marinimicrobia bacterium]|nr:hypothetical protein [Candidatus Neomarinimicrobiota bacterium]
MKIYISALPHNPWWGEGTPQYKDNPAMVEGTIPNQTLVEQEWKHLKESLDKASNGYEVIPFPVKLDSVDFGTLKHDFVFVRDLFISNLKGEVVIARFREKERQAEEEIIEDWLNHNHIKTHNLPFDKDYFVEGGEFSFCPNENILFAGLSRNNTSGNAKTAELLNVDELVELKAKAFHLDTVFTPVMNKQNELCLVIACTQLLENDSIQQLQTFTKHRGIQLLDIPPSEAIGIGNQLGSFAVNCLPLPGILLGSAPFISKSVNLAFAEHNINHSIVPLTQFRLSGGSVHCLTNEL